MCVGPIRSIAPPRSSSISGLFPDLRRSLSHCSSFIVYHYSAAPRSSYSTLSLRGSNPEPSLFAVFRTILPQSISYQLPFPHLSLHCWLFLLYLSYAAYGRNFLCRGCMYLILNTRHLVCEFDLAGFHLNMNPFRIVTERQRSSITPALSPHDHLNLFWHILKENIFVGPK